MTIVMPTGKKRGEELRRWLDQKQGSRTSRHVSKHAKARRGEGKGGRNAWKRDER